MVNRGMPEQDMDQFITTVGSTFIWHELYAPQGQPAIDFYTECLDFGSEDMDMGEMGKYRMLTKNGRGIAGVMGTSEMPDMKDVPPHWAVYLSVDDVDARLEKCKAKGAEVVVPPFDVPTVGRMTLMKDPFGAHIWLYKPAPM